MVCSSSRDQKQKISGVLSLLMKGGIIISSATIFQNVTCENYKNPVAQTQLHKAKESGKYEPESALVGCV